MKYTVKVLCILSALIILFTSCKASTGKGDLPQTDGEGNAIVTEATGKTWESRTNSKGERIPNVFDDAASSSPDADPAKPPEDPIMGKDAAKNYHSSHKVVSVVSGSAASENFNPWHEGRDVESLFDGKDGFFNEDEQTKMGGNAQMGRVVVTFRTEKTTLVGYAFVTGNDSANYPDRTPLEWTFYGSKDGKEWTVIDYVYDSAMDPRDHEYYGYEIDKDKQAEYKYYRIDFTLSLTASPLTSFQLNELYLYAAKS